VSKFLIICISIVIIVVTSGCGKSVPSNTSTSGSTTTEASHPPVTKPTTGSPIVYGIDVNQFDSDIGASNLPRVLKLIEQSGATAVRIGGAWADAEPSNDVFNWTSIDRLFSLASSDKLTVLFELGNEPNWDATGGNISAPPIDCNSSTSSCNSVKAYVTALINHCKSEGLQYIITRNEPQNFNKNWVGGTASAFAHFQQVVYQTAHALDPQIKILNGGTEATSSSLDALRAKLGPITPYEMEASSFAQSLYSNPQWCDSIDILDIHVGDHGPIYSPQIVDASEQAVMSCDGGRHLPVWVTEVGYPSTPSLQNSSVYNIELEGKYQGGETGQANFLTDTFDALAKDSNVIGIDWTFMIDPNTSQTPPPNASYNETFSAGFGEGLAYSNYQLKASYTAYQKIARGS
jgi:hypothetical protein